MFTLLGEARGLSSLYGLTASPPSPETRAKYRRALDRCLAGERPEDAPSYRTALWLRSAVRSGAVLRLGELAAALEEALAAGDAAAAAAAAAGIGGCRDALLRFPSAPVGRRRVPGGRSAGAAA